MSTQAQLFVLRTCEKCGVGIDERHAAARYCLDCAQERDRANHQRAGNAYYRRIRDDPERRAARVLRRHGLTVALAREILACQSDRCPICEEELDDFGHRRCSAQVDHDHRTGLVRGILCSRCNKFLGFAGPDGDDRDLLGGRALAYLRMPPTKVLAMIGAAHWIGADDLPDPEAERLRYRARQQKWTIRSKGTRAPGEAPA